MIRGVRLLLAMAALAAPLATASAADPQKKPAEKTAAKKNDDGDFERRLAELKQKSTKHFAIRMAPTDDPTVLPASELPAGPVLVANDRMGIYTPPLITVEDIQTVVGRHMVDLRTCYKEQLAVDPEWADDMILDLAVKKTGRVFEVDVSPGRVRRAVIGQCLMSKVPQWRFPEFTGETDEGITQEVVNASFPFSFSVTNR